jgi:hypothetical protein
MLGPNWHPSPAFPQLCLTVFQPHLSPLSGTRVISDQSGVGLPRWPRGIVSLLG